MKKNEKIISIIVPVYNVEKYLSKCIDSILNQNFKDFELILVDDGSTDNSGKICDDYKKCDKRIKVIHKRNGGISDARNKGIEFSTGKYITLIDSDDYIDINYLDQLMNIVNKTGADLLISGPVDFKENVTPKAIDSDYFEVITEKEAFRKMLIQEDIDVSAWAKVYNRKIFDYVKYPVKELYEDLKVIDKVVEKSNVIAYTKYKGYFYLQRNGSTMYSKINREKISLIDAAENLMNKVKTKYPDLEFVALKRYIFCNYHILGRAIFDNSFKKDCIEIRNNILSYRKIILSNKVFSKKEKIATIFLNFGIKFYKIFWKFYCKIKNKEMRD